jgi:uncharacterized damage-inducible protein DinB
MRYTPQDGFPYYLALTNNAELLPLFTSPSALEFLAKISEDKASYRYQPDKWSIKQVVGHITDHERIKISRAFLLSRQQSVQLWGYDEKALVANSRFEELTLRDLTQDLANVRRASISFIDTLSARQLQIRGVAKTHEVSLGDFLKSIIGHEIHHLSILKEKYL